MLDDETLVAKLEEINKKLNEIKNEQNKLKNEINNNNKILMQRINKLQEYNEINDMRSKYFNEKLEYLSQKISQIYY